MNLIFIFGPAAVGKMTVGNELAKLTDFKLFHNHMTIDLVTKIFPFETPQFRRLCDSFRKQIFEEVAESDIPGIIFTYVWAFDQQEDHDFVNEVADIFKSRGGKVYFIELEASQKTRLERNRTEFRLAEKKPKRDLVWSDNNLKELDEKYVLNTKDDFPLSEEMYLKINNDDLEPGEVAGRIIKEFGLV